MRTLTTILAAAGATDPGRLRATSTKIAFTWTRRAAFSWWSTASAARRRRKAADVALAMLRERLERETGPVRERVREAIAIANNEIYRLASTRPEWNGMACVLTIAVVKDGVATIGHVGDTRLYKLHGGRIEKITRDHSPVGEREDANEISELDAMRHPRRNEVYRDVGSEPHAPSDSDFVELTRSRSIPMRPCCCAATG
jgi:serine/threonine protein phosphatase PrpC